MGLQLSLIILFFPFLLDISDYEPGNVSQKISQRHVIPLFALFVAVLVR